MALRCLAPCPRRRRRSGSPSQTLEGVGQSSGGRPGGTSRPSTPSVITWGTPPTAVATMARPDAGRLHQADRQPLVVGGEHEDVGEPASRRSTSSRWPRNWNRPSRPSWRCRFSSSSVHRPPSHGGEPEGQRRGRRPDGPPPAGRRSPSRGGGWPPSCTSSSSSATPSSARTSAPYLVALRRAGRRARRGPRRAR